MIRKEIQVVEVERNGRMSPWGNHPKFSTEAEAEAWIMDVLSKQIADCLGYGAFQVRTVFVIENEVKLLP